MPACGRMERMWGHRAGQAETWVLCERGVSRLCHVGLSLVVRQYRPMMVSPALGRYARCRNKGVCLRFFLMCAVLKMS